MYSRSAFHIENGRIVLGRRFPIRSFPAETMWRETIGTIGISFAIIDW